MERNMLASLVGWKVLASVSNERVDRHIEPSIRGAPVKTVMQAFIADQCLGELLRKFTWRTRRILLLRRDQIAARFHGGSFIFADAPEYDLVFARNRVEIPRTVAVHQGNRKMPVFGSDYQGCYSVPLCYEPMHLLIFYDESHPS